MIYIDVLMIINVYIGYFLLSATKKIIGITVKRWRMILGCVLIGIFSLLILLELKTLEISIIKLLMAGILCYVVFPCKRIKLFLKTIICFFIVNFLFGGIMFALYYFITPVNMSYNNGVAYFDINVVILSLFTIIAYILISGFDYIIRRKTTTQETCQVTIEYGGRQMIVNALVDNGNKLVDIFTGLPVMVCELDALKSTLPQKLIEYLKTKGGSLNEDFELAKTVRVIPITVVSGESSLMAFKPSKVKVGDSERNMLVAVTTQHLSDGSFKAIVSHG